jgi:hypothetical protein
MYVGPSSEGSLQTDVISFCNEDYLLLLLIETRDSLLPEYRPVNQTRACRFLRSLLNDLMYLLQGVTYASGGLERMSSDTLPVKLSPHGCAV